MPGASATGGVGGGRGVPGVRARSRRGRRAGSDGSGRRLRELRNREPQRFDFLRQARDAHRVLVDALSDNAQIAAELVDGELLIGERLARRVGLIVEPRVDGLERRGQLLEGGLHLLLQLLRLLLQHADVGHHLHFAARLGARPAPPSGQR